jgi:hypothetical protein
VVAEPVITVNYEMHYEILTCPDFSIDEVNEIMDIVEPIFLQTFGIKLIRQTSTTTTALTQRDGCELPDDMACDDICRRINMCRRRHHKSSNHFITVNMGDRNRSVFKFVNYALCFLGTNNNHRPVSGLSDPWGDTMIVSFYARDMEQIVAHEISHLFGATDGGCTDYDCVMYEESIVTIHDRWCDFHDAQIRTGIHLR